MEDTKNKLRQECWDNALHTFGFEYIFNKRALRYSKYVNSLKVLGIIVPVTVGATAIGYGYESIFLKWVITLAIPFTIIQLIISVIAVVNKWDDELAYSYEASVDHSTLSSEFRTLGNRPPEDYEELKRLYDLILTRYNNRQDQDNKHNIKEWELRMGMRYALREFKRECYGCNKIPISMESSDCDVCGKFNKSITLKIFKL